jgi:hypothetical protein
MADAGGFVCPEPTCQKSFTRQYNLNKHFQRTHIHAELIEKCQLCGQLFENCEKLQKHYRISHRPSRKFFIKESAFRKAFVTYRYNFPEDQIYFAHAQASIKNIIKQQILLEAAKKTVCKVSLIFIAQMSMIDHAGEKLTTASIPFRSPAFFANAAASASITKNIISSFNHQASSLDDFMQSGSNWQFERGLVFDIEIGGLNRITAGSDDAQTSTSTKNDVGERISCDKFKNKKFLYNPSNQDEKCFLYCIAYFLYKTKLTKVMTLEKYVKTFNTKNLTFPISIEDIKRFLKLNQHLNLKINILYRNVDGDIFPYEYGLGNGKKIVTLLMVQKRILKNGANHFLLVENPNKYLRHVYGEPGVSRSQTYQKAFFCLNCFSRFNSERTLSEHERLCCLNKPRLEIVPEKNVDDTIRFKNTERQHPLEYVAFLDFESALPKKENFCVVCKTLKCKCDTSFTEIISDQEAIGYSFLVLGPDEKIIHERSFMGNNAATDFVQHLLNEENKWVKCLLGESKDIVMTDIDVKTFSKATKCYICTKEFLETVVKVRDHSHVTGDFLGAACQSCNLRRRKPRALKVFVHNGSR